MTIQLKIPKLACAACVNTITEAIQDVDADARVDANIKSKVVNVETQTSEADIKKAVADAGYPSNS